MFSVNSNYEDESSQWVHRAAACRHNAAAVSTVEGVLSIRGATRQAFFGVDDGGRGGAITPPPTSGRVGCHGNVRVVQQLWNLLASCIEVMVMTYQRSNQGQGRTRSSSVPKEKQDSLSVGSPVSVSVTLSDSMPMGDGSDVDWGYSVLGRSMLCRCVNLLRQNGDLQTLATVVCIFGGSEQLVALMTPGEILQTVQHCTSLYLNVAVHLYFLPNLWHIILIN
jgi:hypothetical protein